MAEIKKVFQKTIEHEHTLLTEDGYILTLLRLPIPGSEKRVYYETTNFEESPENKKRPVVLFVHGMVVDGTHWLINSSDLTLPIKLQNAGYDCWMVNLRGTSLSQGHNKMSSDSADYWNFSIDEIARYDIPSTIHYILGTTGQTNLIYIGHSLGCTALFASASIKPEICSKVSTMVALAPAVYRISNIQSKFAKVGLLLATKIFGKYKWLYSRNMTPKPITDIANSTYVPFVSKDKLAEWILKNVFASIGVIDGSLTQIEKIADVTSEFPAPTSLKVFCHISQCFNSKTFQQYDYGSSKNLKLYGQSSPPQYDLGKVKIPVATFYALKDEMCTPEDVTQLANELPNLIDNIEIAHPHFGHNDFIYGKDADELVYEKVLEICTKFTS